MGEISKAAEIEYLIQLINDFAEDAPLWQLREMHAWLCVRFGLDA